MGFKERRVREKNEVRTKIMNAARELFVKEGFDSVSMRKIAEAVEYSPTIIYAYFQDKESLLREICNEDFGAMSAAFAHVGQIPDPIERIRQLGAVYAKFGLENPNHYRLMFMTACHNLEPLPEDLEDRGNPDQDGYAFLKSCVEEGLRAGRFRPELTDAELISQTFWAAVHGVVSLQIAKCNDRWIRWAPLEQRVHLIIEAGLRGLLKDPQH
jgi:AcrR family transcriptional regulator